MTSTEIQHVVFHVSGKTRDDIPLGAHPGYIEWAIIHIRGVAKRQMFKCMLPIERSRHPEFFNPTNSTQSIHANVLADVKDGRITYTQSLF
jgi:hypothetical protein